MSARDPSPAARAVVLVVFFMMLTPSASLWAQSAPGRAPGSLRLEDGLAGLQARGLRVIYSSEVVLPEMRVPAARDLDTPRRTLDAWLAMHGLIARDGPGGTVLVVKNPRARPSPTPLRPRPGLPPAVQEPVEPSPRFAESVVVTDVAPGAAMTGSAPLEIRPIDVRTMAGGFEDPMRALQTLPGVTATEELGSRLAVRGSSPDQNLVVLDGVEIHNPFRLLLPSEDLAVGGLASRFNPETTAAIEFVPGAFDVTYGDRLSSLLLVTSRDGATAKRVQGSAFAGVAEANVIAEGRWPLTSTGSWLVSVRRSHLGVLAEHLFASTVPSAGDVHARAAWQPRPGQRLSVAGLAALERARPVDGVSDARQYARGASGLGSATFEAAVGGRGLSRTMLSFSRFDDRVTAVEHSIDNSRGANTPESIASGALLSFDARRRLTVGNLTLRQTLTVTPGPRHTLDLGAEVHALDTAWTWQLSGDRSLQQANGSSLRLGAGLPAASSSSRFGVRSGAWIQDRWELGPRLVVQPGLRFDRSSLARHATTAPRLAATVRASARTRIDAAVGLYAQSPGYEKVFQSDYFVDLSTPSALALESERAMHAVLGLQHRLGGGVTLRVDGYAKRFSDLIVGRLETEAERLARVATYDVPADLATAVPGEARITTEPVNGAIGSAYGVEATLSHVPARPSARVSGWMAYALGRAHRTVYGATVPFDYDRRHALTGVGTIRFGSRVDVSATGRWSSGLPRTPVRGVALSLALDADDRDGDGNRSEWLPQRDERGAPLFQPDFGGVANVNTARLPHFARVDARLTYRPPWSGDRWTFYLDVLNVFNASNVWTIDTPLTRDANGDRPVVVERAQDRGVPFFPSIGIRFWF